MKWEQDRENPKTKQAEESEVDGARHATPLLGKI
jgi:hypothetical protein